MRIPFGASVRTTIESGVPGDGIFWMIVRGIEAFPVVVGDLQLPAAARLRLFRFNGTTQPKQLITLASVPKGMAGAVLNVKFDAAGSGGTAAGTTGNKSRPGASAHPNAPQRFGARSGAGSGNRGGVLDYLEACVRAQFDGSDEVTFLSSGAEDCECIDRRYQRIPPNPRHYLARVLLQHI